MNLQQLIQQLNTDADTIVALGQLNAADSLKLVRAIYGVLAAWQAVDRVAGL